MSGDFWSRRRAAVAEEALEDERVALAEVEAANEAELAARDDAELLEELGLPEPEALETPEAVREFLGSALPQRLKTRALRRLWRLNPVLANLDGLIDYGEDFTDAATVVENLQTAYQVGKGMLAHIEALAEKAAAEAAREEQETDEPEPELEDEDETVEPIVLADLPEAPPVTETYDDDAMPLPVRRRMAFSFDAASSEGAR